MYGGHLVCLYFDWDSLAAEQRAPEATSTLFATVNFFYFLDYKKYANVLKRILKLK